MASVHELHNWLLNEEEATGGQLWRLSQHIWSNPELAFQEHQAHKFLTDFLESKGFEVQRNYFLPTAFRAEYQLCKSAEDTSGPVICFLCEYDALPEIGHGCGHNLIAEVGVAAALALKWATATRMDKGENIPGKIVVLGTPAEERGGGKILLSREGAFKDVDIILMAHPCGGYNTAFGTSLVSCLEVSVEYRGVSSHAGVAPWKGVNALDAAVACYTNVSLLKQHILPNWRISGIITKGGSAANMIPHETALLFFLRAPKAKDMEELLSKFKKCASAAADATGCEWEYKVLWDTYYKDVIQNRALEECFQKHIEELGFKYTSDQVFVASSDFGNVSHLAASIHPFYSISTPFTNHTENFTAQSGTQDAQEETMKTAAAIATTALDVLSNASLFERTKQQYRDALAEEQN